MWAHSSERAKGIAQRRSECSVVQSRPKVTQLTCQGGEKPSPRPVLAGIDSSTRPKLQVA
jgi:hypothetical protein